MVFTFLWFLFVCAWTVRWWTALLLHPEPDYALDASVSLVAIYTWHKSLKAALKRPEFPLPVRWGM